MNKTVARWQFETERQEQPLILIRGVITAGQKSPRTCPVTVEVRVLVVIPHWIPPGRKSCITACTCILPETNKNLIFHLGIRDTQLTMSPQRWQIPFCNYRYLLLPGDMLRNPLPLPHILKSVFGICKVCMKVIIVC